MVDDLFTSQLSDYSLFGPMEFAAIALVRSRVIGSCSSTDSFSLSRDQPLTCRNYISNAFLGQCHICKVKFLMKGKAVSFQGEAC